MVSELLRKGDFLAIAIRKQDELYSIENAENVLFDKLDEAIDDIENGRVISEEEMWAELDYFRKMAKEY